MKKFVAGMMLAGLVLIPVTGMTAEARAEISISERVTKSVAEAEAAYSKGLALKADAQKAADQAAANLEKAKTDLKLAQASGDKEKIKAAQAAMLMSKRVAEDKGRALSKVSGLVERLKVILDKAREAAATIAKAKTPAESHAELRKLEGLVNGAQGIVVSIEQALKPHPHIEVIGVTVPATTTSTTQPTPTQVGQIRG